jgi:predicted ArsR family transcriptional regulator
LLHVLKTRGPQTTQALASHLAITLAGARKHLNALQAHGLLAHEDIARSVGRPKRVWRLTGKAERRFPDSHEYLTLELITSARQIFGEDGLDRLISDRETAIQKRYQSALASLPNLAQKVARLAELRTQEGYMAEWKALPDGDLLLSENHCPICAAAKLCQGFCRSELRIFAEALGENVRIERSEHILAGARRCAYRITEISGRPE